MSIYIIILAWLGMAAIFSNIVLRQYLNHSSYAEYKKYLWVFNFIVFSPIIIISGNRPGWFSDTAAYMISFTNLPDSFIGLYNYIISIRKDRSFYLFSALIKILITKDPRIYLFLIALFQGFSLVKFFQNYSSSYIVSVFLFVASADYVMWMCNGIRQFVAVAIILFAAPYIIKKKYICAIAIILLASTFHLSTIITIPFIFIVQGLVWNKKTVLFILIGIFIVLFVDQFISFLDYFLDGTQYENVISTTEKYGYKGTNILRVAVYSIPAILSFVYRNNINRERETNQVVMISANMSIVSLGFYIISIVTSGIYFGRLPIYFSLYGYLLIPWIIKNCIKSKYIVYVLMIILYLLYYYVEVHLHYGLF